MSAARYQGPERRAIDCASTGCLAVDALREHIDTRLDAQDARLADLGAKLAPVHDLYTSGRVGARIAAWLVSVAAGLGAVWAYLWPKK